MRSLLVKLVIDNMFLDGSGFKPSLSMKKYLLISLLPNFLGIFTLKGTKKFGSKVVNRQFFHRKTVFHIKILSIINFTTKLISIKD